MWEKGIKLSKFRESGDDYTATPLSQSVLLIGFNVLWPELINIGAVGIAQLKTNIFCFVAVIPLIPQHNMV